MLNCTDPECILHHHHVDSIQHYLQDDRQHHEHSSIMSGDANNNLFQGFVNNGTNQEYSSEHVDAPNEGVYMVCGVLIAMVLVAVIIVVLAVTISKLRKREETAAAAATAAASATTTTPTVVNNNNNNNVVDCQLPHAQPLEATIVTNVSCEVGETPVPLPFLWQYSAKNAAARSTNGYNSPHRMYNFDQDTMCTIPIEENGDHRKGIRKNLRGKWRRLVHKKQQQQDAYKIPAELRDQLKQIYVY